MDPAADSIDRLAEPLSHSEPKVRERLETLRVPQWNTLGWLRHGFSTRKGGISRFLSGASGVGEMNLGYVSSDSPEAVLYNRRILLDSLQSREVSQPPPAVIEQIPLVTLRQMHSSLVRRAGRADVAERASMWGDGLVTDEFDVFLGIQTADCLPILIADTRRRIVAALHAGWRGTLKGIAQRGIESMRTEFGSRPEDLTAAIGPGIGSCCFFVGKEVEKAFCARFPYAKELFHSEEGLRLDLVEANRRQLLDAGLLPENIFVLNECTSCRTERFFSYRAERGKTGRMMAVIGIAAQQ